ncbi:MAG: hypothetical protein AB7F43_06450 [Bacteriovoracia bacterium]
MILLPLFLALMTQASWAEPNREPARASRFRSGDEVRTINPNNQIRVRENGKTVIYKKRNVVDFDDSLIEGEVKNPSDFYFVHRPQEKFGSLVQKRRDFHREMLRDSVNLR